MKLYQAVRMAVEAKLLCERFTFLHYVYIAYLFVSEGNVDLYLHILLFTKQAAIYSSFLFKFAIANISYYLSF
jgi:hypothetical protein